MIPSSDLKVMVCCTKVSWHAEVLGKCAALDLSFILLILIISELLKIKKKLVIAEIKHLGDNHLDFRNAVVDNVSM